MILCTLPVSIRGLESRSRFPSSQKVKEDVGVIASRPPRRDTPFKIHYCCELPFFEAESTRACLLEMLALLSRGLSEGTWCSLSPAPPCIYHVAGISSARFVHCPLKSGIAGHHHALVHRTSGAAPAWCSCQMDTFALPGVRACVLACLRAITKRFSL